MHLSVPTMARCGWMAGAFAALLVLGGCGGGGRGTEAPTAIPNSGSTLSISGSPAATVAANSTYSFSPSVANSNGGTRSFSVTNVPSWASFNKDTGQLSGRPATSDVGTYNSIVISVSDGSNSASLPAFSIQVTAAGNTPPVISGNPATSVAAGSAYTFTPAASDADQNALTFSIANKPAWASFSSATGQLSGMPATGDVGTFASIQVSVSDGTASVSLPAFSIVVTQTVAGSVALTWVMPTQNTDGSALTDLSGYRIHYGTNASALNQTADVTDPAATSYTVQGLSTGTYYFTMSAYNASAESVQTNSVSATVP